MSRSVEQLVRLVDDLRETARITRGELQLQYEAVDMKDVVEQAVETCVPLAQSSRVQIHVDVPESPLFVSGDPVRLVRIVANVLNNAANYTP
jgi:signal transduction histidine kinase